MYTVDVVVKGVSPLMQNRFPMPDFTIATKGGHKHSGSIDYSAEWIEKLYMDSEGNVYQPASHISGTLKKAAASFKIQGGRGKTYKDLMDSAIVISPERIYHEGIKMTDPTAVTPDADEPLYIDQRPVVVQRARVTRLRPALSPGWVLNFEIQVFDDQVPPEMLQEILSYAGKAVGIGDMRPKFGRFSVIKFEVHK